MSARSLRTALARMRELSPPVPTTEAGSGDSAAGEESHFPQGFSESVPTVPTVTTEIVASSNFCVRRGRRSRNRRAHTKIGGDRWGQWGQPSARRVSAVPTT